MFLYFEAHSCDMTSNRGSCLSPYRQVSYIEVYDGYLYIQHQKGFHRWKLQFSLPNVVLLNHVDNEKPFPKVFGATSNNIVSSSRGLSIIILLIVTLTECWIRYLNKKSVAVPTLTITNSTWHPKRVQEVRRLYPSAVTITRYVLSLLPTLASDL
jgi:hypothetical protein